MERLPLPLFLLGLVALYIGERALGGASRYIVDAGAVALLIGAFAIAVLRFRKDHAERRNAYGRVAFEYGLCVVALLIYGVQLPALDLIGPGDLSTSMQVLWPTLLILGIVPAIAMELAIGGMARSPTLELRRVLLAGRAARVVGLAVVAFSGFNFAASKWNQKYDLSYFRTTKPGTSTLALAEGLSSPVRFVLFYPPGNQVAEQARDYLDELAAASPHATVEVVDQALDPDLAKKLGVRANGYLAIEGGDKHENLRLGLDMEDRSTRKNLRKLDSEVQRRLIEVVRPPRVAYFTTGHTERDYAPPKDDKRLGYGDLKTYLRLLGYKVMRLGMGEGLGSEIPGDASLVIVAGPTEPFLPVERETLRQYLERGGSMLVAMDPDHGTTDNDLLEMLGVRVTGSLAATSNPRYQVRVEGKGVTPYNFATNRTTSHDSVKTLHGSSGRYGILLLGAGRVEKLPKPPPELKHTFTLRSMSDSWIDENGNGVQDRKTEKRTSVDLAVAIEGTLKPSKPLTAVAKDAATGDKPQTDKAEGADEKKVDDKGADEKIADEKGVEKKKEEGKKDEDTTEDKPKPMRAIVLADADIGGDGVIRVAGNKYFFLDGIRWLANDEETAGTVESEEDVPIVHRRDKDTFWFYSTSFLVPALVLGGGLFFTRRSSRKGRQA